MVEITKDKVLAICLCKLPTIHCNSDSKSKQVLICHCSMCRTQSGSTCVPFATFSKSEVKISDRLTWFESSAIEGRVTSKRIFCSTCGTNVGMDYGEKHTIWLSLGSFVLFENDWV